METITKETHIIYKTVDVTTGEYYIGLRSWRGDIEPPGYFGSYKKDSDWRPNKKNLVRITLAEYPDRETLKDEEVKWIGRHLGKPFCKNQHNIRLAFDTWGKFGKDHPASGKPKTKKFTETLKQSNKNRIWSEEAKEKVRIANSGENSAWWGKNHTQETRKKQSETHKNKPKLECPHCGGLYDAGNAKQYHFDNCKKNPNRLQ